MYLGCRRCALIPQPHFTPWSKKATIKPHGNTHHSFLPRPPIAHSGQTGCRGGRTHPHTAADMIETMYESKGVGLAATQVNVHERVVVMDVSEEHNQPLVMINPELLWKSEERIKGEEGCLSVPGVFDNVERATHIKIQALDAQGDMQTYEADGLMAVCIQHEMDHLMGKVFVEYLSLLKRTRIRGKLVKAQREIER